MVTIDLTQDGRKYGDGDAANEAEARFRDMQSAYLAEESTQAWMLPIELMTKILEQGDLGLQVHLPAIIEVCKIFTVHAKYYYIYLNSNGVRVEDRSILLEFAQKQEQTRKATMDMIVKAARLAKKLSATSIYSELVQLLAEIRFRVGNFRNIATDEPGESEVDKYFMDTGYYKFFTRLERSLMKLAAEYMVVKG